METVSRTPVAGALLTPSWGLTPATAGADGSYSLGAVQSPPTAPYDLTISADGFVARKVWVNRQPGARTGLNLDLIRNAAPFSMDFYRQLVRGAFDSEGAPWSVLRLSTAPTFYVRTVDQNGRAIEPEVISVILEAINRAVPPYTGGRYSASIDSGTDARASQPGLVIVNIVRNPEDDETCGWAYIGRTAGEITLHNDICSCRSVKISGHTVMHEVGHALGFFHVDDLGSVMYPVVPGRCPAGEVSAAELYHAAIAYSRPRGNTEPDDDPSSGPFATSGQELSPGIRVRN